MTAIKVNFEIGHEASLRTKKTPEGFTHDWEVFVRGQEGANISHFVDKVVFHLHETFPKPKRVVKEPPFSIKESGYAGFIFPIEIYLKNRDEPKKIKFTYDFTLQQSGFLKDRYVFHNPNDDFKKKLLKGGGIIVSSNAFYTNPDQENRSRDSFSEEKHAPAKAKPPSDIVKKHKSKEHKDEVPHKSCFENLFGPPIQKPPKISPEIKKVDKNIIPNVKPEKKEKDKSSLDKKSHKEAKSDKQKHREEKDKIKSEKSKSHKDGERSKDKDKAMKRPMERPPSPEIVKKRCPSPARRPPSPTPMRSGSASSIKEEYKPHKSNSELFESKKTQKIEEKQPEIKVDKEVKEKKKKEKKSHDRDKERKDKKEHKKESQKSKESPKEPTRESSKELSKPKHNDMPKEVHTPKDKIKSEKGLNKFSIENLKKSPQEVSEELEDQHKVKDKSDPERKHKHKKKDKKRDDRERQKEHSKEKKHKNRDTPQEKVEIIERRETPIENKRLITESASPISIDTASQCSSKSGIAKVSHIGVEDINSSHSESEDSLMAEEDIDLKIKPEPVLKLDPSPEPHKEREPSPPEPELEPEPEQLETPPHKEKSKKHKDKSAKREEKKRKRKLAEEESEGRKAGKSNDPASLKIDTELGESSGLNSTETKLQDNGVSSSLGEDADAGDLSPDYMVQLRGLQQRIMTIKSNEELVRVVNLIAETGRYEVTTQTFDFDLCLLDRSTVQQLIQLVGC